MITYLLLSLSSEFVDIVPVTYVSTVFVTFVDAVLVTIIDTLSVTFVASSYTFT